MNTRRMAGYSISGKIVIFLTTLFATAQLTHAATVKGASSDFSALPPIVQSPEAKPLVMLSMANDHQLYYKAYTDYDDLTGDGNLETTYSDEFDYYGYFDSGKCYAYSTTLGRFEPSGMAAGTNDHHCDHNAPTLSRWSGNFLNWLAMSRMDVLRKVLYGGKRASDSSSLTVLERAYIPADNHAWSKYFPATDLYKYTPYNSTGHPNGLTFCNVTPRGSNEFSEDNTQAPTLRIASGQWSDWAAQEQKQCLWDTEFTTAENPDGPTGTEGVAELTVRVKVCDSNYLGNETCKNYGSDASPIYKPTGLLNKYGESGAIDFGLLSGSYEKGKSGGVLRKNISPFSDEINADGTFNSTTNGIISTLNKLRISRYSYDYPGYGDSSYDDCPYGQNSWVNGECANWGNPMGEIFLESLRYFSGASGGSTAFSAANDSTWIPGIATSVTWRDPFGVEQTSPAGGGYRQCSKPNIIAISTGVLGFDHDEYTSAGDVGDSLDVDNATDAVGTGELDSTKNYYVGGTSGGGPGDVCQALGISNLSAATGLCPEAAGLQGSFKIAGLAYHAQKSTTDLRSDLDGQQNVNTYAIALAPPIPDIKVNVGGNAVRLIPVGYNRRDDNSMVLVNFEVISQTATTGEFFMNYENAPAGADHDSDFKGYLKYEVNGDQISIVAHNTGSSAGSAMNMGYIIDGVTDPGTYWLASNRDVTVSNSPGGGSYSVDKADIDTACGLLTYPASGSIDICTTDIQTVTGAGTDSTNRDLRGARTHTAGSSNTELLKSPLWYAAKWGNFRDLDDDGTPNQQAEWDVRNNTSGQYSPDGIPDSYFLVTNPQLLESQFEKALQDILQRVSSGTAAAVIADTVSMTGAVIQALYQPAQLFDGNQITWAGLLHSVFIDDQGRLREDTNQNGTLDTTDAWIQIQYNFTVGRTQVYYCDSSATDCDSETLTGVTEIKELEGLKPIWNARDELAELSNAMVTQQRTYTTSFGHSSSGGRHIFTWLDDGDSAVDTGEVVAFTSNNIDSGNYGYLNATDVTEAQNIVDFIRGKEGITGYRSRTADYNGDGTPQAWRLGDIVHSTPLVISSPSDRWDTLHGDTTYTAFRSQYKDRRSVAYVGANDGMLHAFNAGFFDPNNARFCLDADCSGLSEENAHPLGAELWAYAPKNLLPHLRWLTEPDYPHVYYMDGKPQAFDVNIFPDNTDHPGGWGTILVAGMRLGGDGIDVDYDADGTVDYRTRSAYVILDITNPETAPKLLGEFTDADLGFTTSTPEIAVRRQPDSNLDWSNPSSNDWYLVFGSGATDLDTVTSTQQAQVYALKLSLNSTTGRLDFNSTGVITKINTLHNNSFVGDPAVADWNNDFQSDAIYFGSVGGSESSPTGRLMRVAISEDTPANWSSPSDLINPGQPFANKPELRSKDGYPYNEWWVFAGTGRLYTNADNLSTGPQSMYGIREIHDASYPYSLPDVSVTTSTSSTSSYHVQNVTGVKVLTDGSTGTVEIPTGISITDPDGTDPFTYNEFEEVMATRQGWYLNFTPDTARNLTRATYWADLLLFTSYTPPDDTCVPEGWSDLYAVAYHLGIPPWWSFGLDNLNGDEVMPNIQLGYGIASEITLYRDKAGVKPVIQMSTGEIVEMGELQPPGNPPDDDSGGGSNYGRQSWREIPLN